MHRLALPLDAALEQGPATKRHWRCLLRAVKQALIVAIAVGLVVWFAFAVKAGLARNGIGFDMGFLGQAAGFGISEGHVLSWSGVRHFVATDTNADALLAGFANTVKVSVLAILLSTVFGTLLGIGRLSRNWAVKQMSFGLVEFVRNTPLLIQLVFWYFGVVLQLPAISDASIWFGGFLFSQSAIHLPGLAFAEDASQISVWAMLASILLLIEAFRFRRRATWLCLAAMACLGASAALGLPFEVSAARMDDSVVTGGIAVSPESSALLLGLTVYTACFIAEIVRGAILTLPRGQWEAASALGLGRWVAYKDVLIPQVFRVVLPACANQYISLAKSTSLGIAIGFPDLFNVYGTVANQSGRSLEGVMVVMLAYLLLSWIISTMVNLLNKRLLVAGGNAA